MADDYGLWTLLDEPSAEEFEAAEEDESRAGPRAVLGRILRACGLLLVAVAVLLYFTAPFNNLFRGASQRWRRPGTGVQTIPLAPEPTSTPKIPG